jgi:hexokinase
MPRVHEALRLVLGDADDKKITIGLAKDGSGVGAALTALTAKKATERRK